jgi:hypothetical protein
MEIVGRQCELLQVIGTTHTPRRFSRRLNGREEQTDHHADDGDNHQQFHQGEP